MASQERKVAVVTGAGSGIGRGTAQCLAEAGYDIAVWEVRPQAGDAAADELRSMGVRAISIVCDVSSQESVAAAAAATRAELGVPHVLVNNAGINRPARLEDLALEDWDRVIAVDLTGVFICMKEVGRAMLELGRGCIVNIASVAALHPTSYFGAYSPAKAGVVLLTNMAALEWGPRGVRSNALCPGQVRTELSEYAYAIPEVYEQRRNVVPMKRIAAATEMGSVVAFLASDAASYVNGATIVVDGGFSISLMEHIPRTGPGGTITKST
jgi:glucose 1-dehydrogenase